MRLTIIFLLGLGLGWWARAAAFTISSDLFNHSRPGDLGLATLPGTTTTTVYQPSATGDKFSNGAVAVSFKASCWFSGKAQSNTKIPPTLGWLIAPATTMVPLGAHPKF